jgi:carbamoyl-phosphate synthase large subunit
MIQAMGLPVTMITKKLGEGHPNVVDVIRDGTVKAVVNTVAETAAAIRDGFEIRRAAVECRIPCFTSLDTVRATVESLLLSSGAYDVLRTSEYLRVSDGPAQ